MARPPSPGNPGHTPLGRPTGCQGQMAFRVVGPAFRLVLRIHLSHRIVPYPGWAIPI